MDVHIDTINGVHVVALSGTLDANTSPAVQQEILSLAREGARLLFDMRAVSFMSSAGLRLLLTTYRYVGDHQGVVALAGLSEDLKDTMAMAGFLLFFTVYDTTESGLQALQLQP
jgi:anti-sigma B factor antagonist